MTDDDKRLVAFHHHASERFRSQVADLLNYAREDDDPQAAVVVSKVQAIVAESRERIRAVDTMLLSFK